MCVCMCILNRWSHHLQKWQIFFLLWNPLSLTFLLLLFFIELASTCSTIWKNNGDSLSYIMYLWELFCKTGITRVSVKLVWLGSNLQGRLSPLLFNITVCYALSSLTSLNTLCFLSSIPLHFSWFDRYGLTFKTQLRCKFPVWTKCP